MEGIVPYLSHWPAALALLAQPCTAPSTIASAVSAVDEIWYLCGDKSTDVGPHTHTTASLHRAEPRTPKHTARLPRNVWLTVLPCVLLLRCVNVALRCQGNWYSKRALLCGVYLSTELFLVSDRTAGQAATWAFLHRQIEGAKGMAALPAAANDALGYATNIGATLWNRFVPSRR